MATVTPIPPDGPCHPNLIMATSAPKDSSSARGKLLPAQALDLDYYQSTLGLVRSLSILDRLLAPLVLLAMILGVIIGVYAPNVQNAFNGAKLAGTSVRPYPTSRIRSSEC